MARLIYSAITSLDGYVADEDAQFDWSAPVEEVHALITDVLRARRHLPLRAAYVRGEGVLGDGQHPPDQQPVTQDFACIWQAANKVV